MFNIKHATNDTHASHKITPPIKTKQTSTQIKSKIHPIKILVLER
jgi:hypothetical protein